MLLLSFIKLSALLMLIDIWNYCFFSAAEITLLLKVNTFYLLYWTDIREAQWLQVREQFLFNLRSEAYWRGSNLPPRVSSHAVLTDEGSHMFFLSVRT